jgi:hypothetical protein
MNKADIDRLIAVEVDRVNVCAMRLTELYPPVADPNDPHTLESAVAEDIIGYDTCCYLGWALSEIEKLLSMAKDYADLIK